MLETHRGLAVPAPAQFPSWWLPVGLVLMMEKGGGTGHSVRPGSEFCPGFGELMTLAIPALL